ncbi:MAG: TIGR04086 family membrane protein [Clostridiales bacterium]|nr:TIGR04086 family membrane protein [Clostridiales bacterium]
MKTKTVKEKNAVLTILKASLAAAALSVLLVVLFAFVLQKQWLKVDTIPYINIAVKVLAAVLAAIIAVRSGAGRAPLMGAAAAGAYMLITFIVFSLFAGKFDIGLSLLTDVLMCVIAGAAVGIVSNLRRA